VYRAHLHSRFGRGWRRKAPVESLMPLRLAKYGVPLRETAPAGLAAAGIEVEQLFPGERLAEPTPGIDQQPLELEPVVEIEALAPAELAVEQPADRPTVQQPVEEEPFEVTEQYLYNVFVEYANAYSTDGTWHFPSWEQLVEASASWYDVVVPADMAPADLEVFAVSYIAQVSGPQETPSVPVQASEPVAEQVSMEDPATVPEPAAASAARGKSPKRVQARVDDQGEAPVRRSGRGGTTRDRVAEIYRRLSAEEQALRGRPLANVIVEESGGGLKVDTVRRTWISEELLAQYLQEGE
jgi:hypothetical protein